MKALAQKKYENFKSPAISSRDAEAHILKSITKLLMTANKSQSRFHDYAYALSENDKFWRQVSLDNAQEGNKLPEALRAKIISIAGFSLRFSSDALMNKSDLSPLIDINKIFVFGLMGQPEK